MNKLIQLSIASVVAAAAMQAPASAQNAPAAANTLEEIVVTAQKREEAAQKIDISMNVYGAGDLVEKGIVDLQSLSQTDSSVMFNRNGGEATLTIRGVSTNNTTELGNPSVPVGVDNFFVNRAAALDSVLFDIERIEVLLGPQGTLYGRSATGGLVNITTAKPTKDFAASANVEFGNYNAINIGGMLNVPVNDWLQLRAAGSSRRHDGYRTNTFVLDGTAPDKGDDEDSTAGRVTVAFQPSDNFRGWLSYQQTTQGGVGAVSEAIPFVNSTTEGDIVHDKPPLGDPSAFNIYGMPWQRISDKSTKWHFDYDGLPAGATLSYLGGYDNYSWHHASASLSFFGFLADPTNIFLPLRPFVQSEAPKTQNHEIRIASAPGGAFTWQAGLYYFHETNSLSSAGIMNPGTPGAIKLLEFLYDVTTSSKAAYGQGTVHLSDEHAIELGARYSKDEVSRTGTFALPVFGIPPSPNGEGSYNSSKVTWHAAYDYTPTTSNLLYAKLDTGYKPGGFNGTCGSYGPEQVTTGELGSKNRWNADTMQWNAAAFVTDYKNQQIQQFVASCPTGSIVTAAGKSQIYGLETDFKALVQSIGTFDLGLTYLHATYKELALPPTIGAGGLASCAKTVPVLDPSGATIGENCDLSGNTMISSPKIVVSASFDHTWDMATGALNFKIEGRYTAAQNFSAFGYGDTAQDAYTLLNAYLFYKRENWKVGMYGRNLSNKGYINYAAEQSAGGATQYEYSWGAPRIVGIRFEIGTK